MIESSLTAKYILMCDKLRNNTLSDNKLKLKYNNVHKNEMIDYDVIENFCNILKDNKSFKGVLDISYNNLNEINLFNIMCSVYENKNIIGLNIKNNKISKMIFNKILLILEKNYLEYLNIQNTYINTQEIKNIIFTALNKNIISLKLPYLNIENFQFLINNLKDNNSINKLYFFISYNNQGYKNCIVEDENVINNYDDYTNNVKDLFKELLTVIEKKTNIKCVKCDADCHDKELNEIISFINSTCEKHKNNLEKIHIINDNKMQINSFEKMKLLISDINGKGKHIEKFEREEKIVLDNDVITFLEKMLQ
ncbi:conserved Plasmodium protein, unknown function [Plasmodium gaboni]|uniref:Leucine-rich repeat protein n=1 Tax=Plasmodium gaboni TaxID=647221 RepID=A0ABY1UQL8_9APIC|nr:conserved Plasmodium protein, unknown function [Plasmodium gaboni]